MNDYRIEWIDILKGIGIVFVVLGHTNISKNISSYIYSFHMPLFFFISGYLFSIKNYPTFKSFFIKKLRTILIPYFIFAFISILFSLFITYTFSHGIGSIDVSKALTEIIISTRNKISINIPLWFLTSLFIIEIAFYFMKKYIPNKLLALIIIILGVINFKSIGKPLLPWTIDSSGYYIGFYYLGNLINENIKNKDWDINKQLITFAFLLININLIYNIFGIKDVNITLVHNYLYSIGKAVLMFAFYIVISQKISSNKISNKILSYLGQNSLIIMSLHILVFKIINIINNSFLRLPQTNALGIMNTLITLFSLVPIINFINRYLPFILGKDMRFKPLHKISL